MSNRPTKALMPDDLFKHICESEDCCTVTWVVAKPGRSKAEAEAYLCEYHVNPDQTICTHEHDCCGNWYHAELEYIGEMPQGFFHYRQSWWLNV